MASPTLKFKRGLFQDLPTLAVGEPGFTTDRYQLYVGSPSGNQLIGDGDFWTLNTTTAGGGIKLFEGTNNGTNYVQLTSPDSLASNLEFTLPSADATATGQVLKSDGAGNLSFSDVALANIDIDGGTDIGAAIVDADLFIVDDGASGTNRKTTASRLKSYVLGGGGGGSTFDSVVVGGAVTITSGGIDIAAGVVTATTFDGNVTGNVTGDVTGNADTATNATSANTVKTITNGDDATQFLTFVGDNNGSATSEAVRTDAGITYNPNSDLLTAGALSVTGNITANGNIAGDNSTNISGINDIGAVDLDLSGTLQFDSTGPAIDTVKDEDNMSSNSATSLATQQSIKAYVDSSVSGVAVTFAVAADSGTTDVFQTAETLTFSGTANEVETAVTDNTVTFGLPSTVNITTELDVPTIETGAIQAKDGTAAITLTDSTGKVTVATDLEAQGTFTAAAGAIFQGNTDIGNQTSDTLTVTARIDSNLIPTPDAQKNLGSASLAWNQGFIDQVSGIQANFTGVTSSVTYKGTTLDLTGGGTFGGNVSITGNLSVGGSVTNIDVEDLRIVSPVIELGLQRAADGSLQPPANVTTYNSGVVMYYNHVGINSTNAKLAAMFAKVKQGGDMRIGFATDVTITTVGAGDSVASVAAWADIEAKGLWINDCAGSSQVINCYTNERRLENITVDGGSFS